VLVIAENIDDMTADTPSATTTKATKTSIKVKPRGAA
jgi:hypothetical protein